MPKTQKEDGYEVCTHTCPGRDCISSKTTTILWKKEGNACQRHCASAQKHPQCLESGICARSDCIGRKFTLNAAGVRPPTAVELAMFAESPASSRSCSGTLLTVTPPILDRCRVKECFTKNYRS